MFEVKMFEIRDSATFVPAVATRITKDLHPDRLTETYLLGRNGFGAGQSLVYFHPMNRERVTYDPHKWGDRTFFVAHKYVLENWDELKSGDVVDVEFILGERETPKVSESEEQFA